MLRVYVIGPNHTLEAKALTDAERTALIDAADLCMVTPDRFEKGTRVVLPEGAFVVMNVRDGGKTLILEPVSGHA